MLRGLSIFFTVYVVLLLLLFLLLLLLPLLLLPLLLLLLFFLRFFSSLSCLLFYFFFFSFFLFFFFFFFFFFSYYQPEERWVNPYFSTILSHWVPLPLPGPPQTKMIRFLLISKAGLSTMSTIRHVSWWISSFLPSAGISANLLRLAYAWN